MTQENPNYIDRKLFIPKEVHKVSLKKGEVLVWALDLEQYKDLPADHVHDLMKFTQEMLNKQFPKNKVIVTLGSITLTTLKEDSPGD